jgi:hypothetical protein
MDNIILGKGIIYLMLPFRFNSRILPDSTFENEIWTFYEGDGKQFEFLLEHVREFFTRNLVSGSLDESACCIFKLKKEAIPFKLFNNRTYWISSKSFDVLNEPSKHLKLPIRLDPESFTMVCLPVAGIAILVYSIELQNSKNNDPNPGLSDFIRLNYLLKIYGRQDEAFIISQNSRPDERRRAVSLTSNKFLTESSDAESIETRGWRPGHLINYLLCEMDSKLGIEFFNKCHLVPFSYFQPASEIADELLIKRALFYLRNGYDFDFAPSSSILTYNEPIVNPYKQIYYTASIEGVAILNNPGDYDSDYIKTFYSGSFKNSYWVAILALMQRAIILQLLKEVSNVDPDDHLRIKDYLRRFTGISLKALFSKISVFHQHNDFYDLMINKLQINELQNEIKDELNELNNLQRQFHEDEVERHEVIEKQHEKKLNFILFALSVLSLAEITYNIINDLTLPLTMHIIAIGIPLTLGLIIWQILKFRK